VKFNLEMPVGLGTADPQAVMAVARAAEAGGFHALAVTSRIRLMTYLTVAVGSGYLRSEFAALGRSFEDRNALTDEALEVLSSGFDPDGLTFHGRDFVAVDQVCAPGPVQLPHPPIWAGGNSRRSRERAARYGQGWAPCSRPTSSRGRFAPPR